MFGSYFAFDHVHTPQFGTPPDGSEPSPRGPFGDALLQTDAAVGVVLQELRQAPHRGRTLVLLTSDNGAPISECGGIGASNSAHLLMLPSFLPSADC